MMYEAFDFSSIDDFDRHIELSIPNYSSLTKIQGSGVNMLSQRVQSLISGVQLVDSYLKCRRLKIVSTSGLINTD